VVVLIPAYNEADSLPGVLARIPKDMAHLRVIVVDDGSTDDTVSIASSYGAEVVRHKANLGLGAALRSGLRRASDIAPSAVVYLDADGEYDPSDISVVLAPVLAGYADYVLGSRRIKADRRALTRRIGNPIFTILLSLVAGRHVVDAQTGFRAFSRRAAERAEIVHDYNYAQVLTLDLLRKRMRMSQVEVNWSQRKTGESFIRLNYLWKVPLGMVRELISD
jgi:glycosyltransferase involved in cell wall biosynthesis